MQITPLTSSREGIRQFADSLPPVDEILAQLDQNANDRVLLKDMLRLARKRARSLQPTSPPKP